VRNWSPKLTALVVYCAVGEESRALDWQHVVFHPQRCYIKALQTDILGRSTAVAVPVSQRVLRRAEPWADILDWDPECRWVGALPGRFAD
jgi:hypothetical protein